MVWKSRWFFEAVHQYGHPMQTLCRCQRSKSWPWQPKVGSCPQWLGWLIQTSFLYLCHNGIPSLALDHRHNRIFEAGTKDGAALPTTHLSSSFKMQEPLAQRPYVWDLPRRSRPSAQRFLFCFWQRKFFQSVTLELCRHKHAKILISFTLPQVFVSDKKLRPPVNKPCMPNIHSHPTISYLKLHFVLEYAMCVTFFWRFLNWMI